MSHADFHRDSSNAENGGSSTPVPPVIPGGSRGPTGAAPPTPEPIEPPAESLPVRAEVAARPLPPVPPPPPPRSTLPPVRPAVEIRPASGVGTAKGLRWRGELSDVGPNEAGERKQARNETPKETAERTPKDQVTREAPPWLVSMVIHLLLLLALALISTPAGSGLGKVILSIGQTERQAPTELAEFEIATEDVLDEQDLVDFSEVDVDMSSVLDTTLSEVEELTPVDLGAGLELAEVRPMFNGRTGAMKKALLAIYGGTSETEEAVALGLEWLKRNQLKRGNWSMRRPYRDGAFNENECAATAMALLAFLGDGNTHLKGQYAEQVDQGIKFLISKQDRKGFFAHAAREHEKMYAQAQATIAICELYAMTKDSWLRPRAQLALDFAMESQSPQGGWRYRPKFDSDTSVTGWFVMALESGRAGGLDVETPVMAKVTTYLDTAASFDGAGYGYQARSDPSPAMTAEGLLCRQYLGWDRTHPPMGQGLEALLYDAPFDLRDRDVYYWYYATQALHHFGGPLWSQWNNKMRVGLPRSQVKSGREAGSWAPQGDQWGSQYGRLYTTCLSIYCLEVYYRHMPLYQTKE